MNKKSILKSAVISAIMTALLCWVGLIFSFSLVHSGGPLLVVLAPAIAVLMIFDTVKFFATSPDWLVGTLAALAQFICVFAIVHGVRWFKARPKL